MSVRVMSWVFENSDEELGARLVLLALADHAQDDGRGAYPSVATIARKTRMSIRGVQYALARLKESGAVRPDGLGPRGTVSYSIVMGGADFAGGAIDDVAGVQAASPEPSLGTVSQREAQAMKVALRGRRIYDEDGIEF